MVITRDTQFGN